jgi:hypothetical protein
MSNYIQVPFLFHVSKPAINLACTVNILYLQEMIQFHFDYHLGLLNKIFKDDSDIYAFQNMQTCVPVL